MIPAKSLVFLIDDDASVRKGVARLLRSARYKSAARRLLDSLTPCEFEVMQLVITGMLNKQIASELSTAEKTIKVHRGRAMQKLRVTSVADLVRWCREHPLRRRCSVRPRSNSHSPKSDRNVR